MRWKKTLFGVTFGRYVDSGRGTIANVSADTESSSKLMSTTIV